MIMRLLMMLVFDHGLVMWLLLPVFMALSPGIAVVSPRPGEALQGVVTITGVADVAGFVSMEVSFAYSNDASHTWFLIDESQQPVSNGTLATWDTAAITDGNYDLRLLVNLKDGTQQQVVIAGLRVRNYTPVEASTPNAVTPGTAQPTLTDTPLPATATPIPPTPTPFPPNPAQLTGWDYFASLALGGMVVLALFGVMWLYLAMKKRSGR